MPLLVSLYEPNAPLILPSNWTEFGRKATHDALLLYFSFEFPDTKSVSRDLLLRSLSRANN
jgi:hypothetical protein